ncbi:MAG: peptidase dimerization domain protein, partial [Bacteroidetes bacterium]
MQGIKAYIDNHKDRFLNELIELLKIPSISADSAYKNDVIKTAEVVAEQLKKAGCENVEICQTKGYPIVYADKIISASLPTVLVYGHY